MTSLPNLPYPDHTNKEHMQAMANVLIRKVPQRFRRSYVSQIMGLGLMRTSWTLETAISFACWMRGIERDLAWFILLGRFPKLADEILEAFAKHIESGKDVSDSTSAGGLNKSEVETAIDMLNMHYQKL